MHFSILRKSHLLITLAGLALAVPLSGDPQNRPAWWTDEGTRVIPPGAIENNKGPANIGQAKHMVAQALKALDTAAPTLATQIRADLAGTAPNFTNRILDLAAPANPAEQEKQKAPLLLGQLKAIAAPFYSRLAASSPANATWLAAERTTNDTNYPNSIFPWTATTDDDANKAIATIGQLKAVFSLRFETLSVFAPGDSDGDGLSDIQEGQLATNPNNSDTDGDQMPDGWEVYYGFDPKNGIASNSSATGPTNDKDFDGKTNLVEALNGTIPISSEEEPAYSFNPITLRWFGVRGVVYVLQWSTNFTVWNTHAIPFLGANSEITALVGDVVGGSPPATFFSRLRVVSDSNPDIDADGLSDVWEIRYFGNLGQIGSGDPDGDNFSTTMELLAGRNPNLSDPVSDASSRSLDVFNLTSF